MRIVQAYSPRVQLAVATFDPNTRQTSTIGYQNVEISTSVDIREGQEVGITTVSKGTPSESLCIVAKAKIVD